VKIAVAGGTGLVGRPTVEAVRRVGHDPVVLARSAGVNLTTGAGLAAALDGVDAVIDLTNTPSFDTDQVRAFFAAQMVERSCCQDRTRGSRRPPSTTGSPPRPA
jgi:uncharacterized protein YbjT (DUF2867 family)